jgi:hypothetical protein
VAKPQSAMPPSIRPSRRATGPGWSSSHRVASQENPTTRAFEIVPMPGISFSGIQSTSTTKLITTTAWPSVIGTCRIRPEWSTSQGARPRSPRTIIARLTPYSTRPT